jgi:hypothetical protein
MAQLETTHTRGCRTPSGNDDMAACCATIEASIGPNDTAPGVSLPSVSAPALSVIRPVVISAAVPRVTAYSARVRSSAWGRSGSSSLRPRDVSMARNAVITRGSVNIVSARASRVLTRSPAWQGNSNRSVQTSHSTRSATEVLNSNRLRPSVFATRSAPNLRAPAAAVCSAAAGAAMVRLTGARSMSQPKAARCSRTAARSEKFRSTNSGIRSRRVAQ